MWRGLGRETQWRAAVEHHDQQGATPSLCPHVTTTFFRCPETTQSKKEPPRGNLKRPTLRDQVALSDWNITGIRLKKAEL